MELSTSELIRKSLHGEWAHPDPAKAMENLDWEKTGEQIPNLPYTIWQLFWHTEYWQRLILQGFKGQTVTWPKELEESWPPSPTPESEQEFQQLVTRFNQQLTDIESLLNDDMLTEDFPGGDGMNNAEFLRVLITHNSYHFGQIMVLRRLLGTL
jgi:uncharacterized damage-inducible protein DinB